MKERTVYILEDVKDWTMVGLLLIGVASGFATACLAPGAIAGHPPTFVHGPIAIAALVALAVVTVHHVLLGIAAPTEIWAAPAASGAYATGVGTLLLVFGPDGFGAHPGMPFLLGLLPAYGALRPIGRSAVRMSRMWSAAARRSNARV